MIHKATGHKDTDYSILDKKVTSVTWVFSTIADDVLSTLLIVLGQKFKGFSVL